MKCTYDEDKKRLNILLNEDIDMDSCRSLRTIVDGYMMKYSPSVCDMDLKSVTFMDSSGLGFIMGRYNLAKMLDCKLNIINANSSVKKILEMSDVRKYIKVM